MDPLIYQLLDFGVIHNFIHQVPEDQEADFATQVGYP